MPADPKDRPDVPSDSPDHHARAPVPADSLDPDDDPGDPPRPSPVREHRPSDDPRRAVERIHALQDRLRSLRLLLGLLVLLGLASLVGAARSAPLDGLYLHIALWFAAQLAALAVIVFGLRWLRRRRFGALPSTRLRRTSDALLYLAAAVGGALALLGFVPVIVADAAAGVDWAIAAMGLLLLLAGLRAGVLHVVRP
jgi:hypothetical protein